VKREVVYGHRNAALHFHAITFHVSQIQTMSIKVSIVEDDSSFRDSMGILINGASGFNCLGSYPNAEVALKQLPREWPDVVLMDIHLPQMSGIDCTTKLKIMRPELQIIMLTVYVDTEQIFKSLQAGASGYLLKQSSPVEILESIKDVRRGGSPMSYMIARKVVQHFQQKPSGIETESLTKREHEILTHLAKGFQHKEIADTLSISILTVRAHIRNIYEKLHVRSRTEAVMKFLGKEVE
jgi:DNA-binding NarL/FixJ family response regulator